MSEYLKELGQRMRSLARGAGYETTTAVAEALGKPASSNATISKWYRGQQWPNREDLERFCGLVGVTVEDLLGGTGSRAAAVADLVVEILARTLAGEDPVHAFDDLVEDPRALSHRERQLVRAGAGALRAGIKESVDWDALGADGQRSHLAQVVEVAQDRRLQEEP